MQRWERQSAGDGPWHGILSTIRDRQSANPMSNDNVSKPFGASSTQAERGSGGEGNAARIH